MRIRLPHPTLCSSRAAAAFTMVEIALSLAIIGFALVAIIGVLPIGMNVQRENREETIINQDAAVFMDAIRSGARGLDDLTHAVLGITNYVTRFDVDTTGNITNMVGPPFRAYAYTYANWSIDGVIQPPDNEIVNGYRIVGLLSTPKYIFDANGFYSNYVVAHVRAISGLAVEKFPQNNDTVLEDAFSYRLITENLEIPVLPDYSTNSTNSVSRELTHNLRELRLLFRWPLLASGKLGNGRQIFRTMVGGPLLRTNDNNLTLYFFQPQTYVKAP
jgi:type II secretory pathway pseudopilin PulG